MQRRKFGREFKIEVVTFIRERGVSVSHAAETWTPSRGTGPSGRRHGRQKAGPPLRFRGRDSTRAEKRG
jgi:transposase-like protein